MFMELVKTLVFHKNIIHETISYNINQIVKFKELRHIVDIDIYLSADYSHYQN